MTDKLVPYDQNELKTIKDMPAGELFKPLQTRISLFNSFVAGTTHIEDQSVFEKMRTGTVLAMKREDNPYDSNAILLLNAQGQKAGYIPEKDNLVFSRLMDAGKFLEAKVLSVEQKRRYWKIEIEIILVDF